MPLVCKILLVYLAGISLVAVVVTIADKSRAVGTSGGCRKPPS